MSELATGSVGQGHIPVSTQRRLEERRLSLTGWNKKSILSAMEEKPSGVTWPWGTRFLVLLLLFHFLGKKGSPSGRVWGPGGHGLSGPSCTCPASSLGAELDSASQKGQG